MKARVNSSVGSAQDQAKMVAVTYKLQKSAWATILDNGFTIGYTTIDLTGDQQADPNLFTSKPGKPYSCLLEKEGLQVTLYAEGRQGDFISLEISIEGKSATPDPIRIETDVKGHLDYNVLLQMS